MGVALRGCFAPGKGGHGASTSPEGCFYVNKKRQPLCADMACFRAEGLAEYNPFIPTWLGAVVQ